MSARNKGANLTGKFTIAVPSDPQYPWYDNTKTPDGVYRGFPPDQKTGASDWGEVYPYISQLQIAGQFSFIKDLSATFAKQLRPLSGVIINGDLTSYGHPDEKLMMTGRHDASDLFSMSVPAGGPLLGLLPAPIYPALGNHDYQNNLPNLDPEKGGTGLNRGPTTMVDYIRSWAKDNKSLLCDFDGKPEYSSWNSAYSGSAVSFTGSLSYSFNVGRVHFVILHNNPAYSASWDPKSSLIDSLNPTYNITQSFEWLERDLQRHYSLGDALIVFTHKYGEEELYGDELIKFNNIMLKYNVSAVLCGHIHWDHGLKRSIAAKSAGEYDVPVYRCGAPSQMTFVVLELDPEHRSMRVIGYTARDPNNFKDWTPVVSSAPSATQKAPFNKYIEIPATSPNGKWPEKVTLRMDNVPADSYILFNCSHGKSIASPNLDTDLDRRVLFDTRYAAHLASVWIFKPTDEIGVFKIVNAQYQNRLLTAPLGAVTEICAANDGAPGNQLWCIPVDPVSKPLLGIPFQLLGKAMLTPLGGKAEIGSVVGPDGATGAGANHCFYQVPGSRLNSYWVLARATLQ
ncbi:hypothetical protein EOB77_10750 [Mesorhizobium sp. M7A.F.Ca.MR.228.00.0.0]|nr:hypothetical protein EOB80_16915 [Mesorhizobium sp. M7A.F.Ca.MR.245.00.0.0]RUV51504.1 hypothetical protein EOB77_10750 [Mesorhizobium sp. M7A.F.Ca.MR.228.00.0.0]